MNENVIVNRDDVKLKNNLNDALCIRFLKEGHHFPNEFTAHIVRNIYDLRGTRANFVVWLKEPTDAERQEVELSLLSGWI